jgi:SprT-like family
MYQFQDETLQKYQKVWYWLEDIFNVELPDKYILSFKRHSTSKAFILAHVYGKKIHGVFINPDHCNRSDEEIIATIAHEFCHAIEISIRNYTGSYHRSEWCRDMGKIGLKPINCSTIPSSEKEVGWKVTHNITDKFRDLIKFRPPECYNLQINKPERKKDKGKNCYICSDPNCEYGVKVWGKKNLRLYCGFCSTNGNLVELVNKI